MIKPIIDFAIITTLDEEKESVCKEFEITDEDKDYISIQSIDRRYCPIYWHKRFFPNEDKNQFYEIAVFQLSEPGNISACQLTTRIVDTFYPQIILLVGIAAGVDRKKQQLGDIVISKEIAYFEKGKDTPQGRQLQPDWEHIKISTYNTFRQLPKFTTPIQQKDQLFRVPNIHDGVIVSSDTVIADRQVRNNIGDQSRKIIAIEMESYGVCHTVSQCNPNVEYLVIKAITDWADEEKNDEWHDYAISAAAKYTKHFVINSDLPLRPFKKERSQEPQTPDDELEKYLEDIQESMHGGNLMFFLGSGINSGENKHSPPRDREIIEELRGKVGSGELADFIGLPCQACTTKPEKRPQSFCPVRRKLLEKTHEKPQLENEQNLAFDKIELQCLAEYYLQDNHTENQLVEKLRGVFKERSEPNKIQTNIAKFTAKSYEKNGFYPLIVTTNYDVGLEKSFKDEEIDIEVLYYIARGKNAGKFQRISYQYEPKNKSYTRVNKFTLATKEDIYSCSGEQQTESPIRLEKPVILKLYGGYIYKGHPQTDLSDLDRENYSFVIAERHHINYYKNFRKGENFPTQLQNCFQRNNILFLGYSTNDEFLRSFLDNFDVLRTPYPTTDDVPKDAQKGWLVQQSEPGILRDRNSWQHWNIKLINYSWQDFVVEELKN